MDINCIIAAKKFGKGGGVTSWNDLTDKPFWESVSRVVIQEGTLGGGPTTGAKDGYGDKYGVLKVSALIPGDTYTVTVDGVEYTGVAEWCADETSDGGNGIRLFNKGEYPEDFSDAPASFGSYSNFVYVSFEDGKRHALKITHVASEVKPLDEKYMPLLSSPNGTKYKLTVADDGTLSAVAE